MHHLRLHPHGSKRGECSKKEIPSLESPGANSQSEQWSSVRRPGAQPFNEVERRGYYPLSAQKQIG